jgi:hypothetical protein
MMFFIHIVNVQINEAGRNDQSLRLNSCATFNEVASDRPDLTVADADVTYSVKIRFRIHDPTVQNNDVIVVSHVADGPRRDS